MTEQTAQAWYMSITRAEGEKILENCKKVEQEQYRDHTIVRCEDRTCLFHRNNSYFCFVGSKRMNKKEFVTRLKTTIDLMY